MDAPNVIYMPGWFDFDARAVQLSPQSETIIESGDMGSYLTIEPSGTGVTHRLVLKKAVSRWLTADAHHSDATD